MFLPLSSDQAKRVKIRKRIAQEEAGLARGRFLRRIWPKGTVPFSVHHQRLAAWPDTAPFALLLDYIWDMLAQIKTGDPKISGF